MSLASPTHLHAFLQAQGIRPCKRLSQNFLIDGNILQKILALAEIQAGEEVLEIGAGPGALTQCLLERGASVTAIEKDPVLAAALHRFTSEGKCHVYTGDVRSFPWETVTRAKVVANLPYHLTTPILAALLPKTSQFSTVTVMVQEEVARRMVAKAGSPDYSALSLFLQFYTIPEYGFFVSRRCFYPAPKVDSAVVHLRLHTPPLADPAPFFKRVRHAFSQRRKMLTTSWRTYYPSTLIGKVLEECALPSTARPEEISCSTFLDLYHRLEGTHASREGLNSRAF